MSNAPPTRSSAAQRKNGAFSICCFCMLLLHCVWTSHLTTVVSMTLRSITHYAQHHASCVDGGQRGLAHLSCEYEMTLLSGLQLSVLHLCGDARLAEENVVLAAFRCEETQTLRVCRRCRQSRSESQKGSYHQLPDDASVCYIF